MLLFPQMLPDWLSVPVLLQQTARVHVVMGNGRGKGLEFQGVCLHCLVRGCSSGIGCHTVDDRRKEGGGVERATGELELGAKSVCVETGERWCSEAEWGQGKNLGKCWRQQWEQPKCYCRSCPALL